MGETRFTEDSLLGGALRLTQPSRTRGYRVNVDALLLAAFAAKGRRAKVACDLGAGIGTVGLYLARSGAAERINLVEIDPDAVQCAQANIEANPMDGKTTVTAFEGDVVAYATRHRGTAGLIVFNPPYVEPGRGRPAKVEPRATARSGKLENFVRAARLLAGHRARVCVIYPATELARVFATLRDRGLEPKRIRAVHATATSAARVFLIEAQHAKEGGLLVMPPLIEREGAAYSKELRAILIPPESGR